MATEGKYHLTCLNKFCNSYRAFQHAQKYSSSLSNSMQAKAQVYAGLVMTIETDIQQGTNVFKLEDLNAAYEKRLRHFHIDVALNRTRLKERFLTIFKSTGYKNNMMEGMLFSYSLKGYMKYYRMPVLLNLFVLQCSKQRTNSNLKANFQIIAKKIMCFIA